MRSQGCFLAAVRSTGYRFSGEGCGQGSLSLNPNSRRFFMMGQLESGATSAQLATSKATRRNGLHRRISVALRFSSGDRRLVFALSSGMQRAQLEDGEVSFRDIS